MGVATNVGFIIEETNVASIHILQTNVASIHLLQTNVASIHILQTVWSSYHGGMVLKLLFLMQLPLHITLGVWFNKK